MFTQEEYVQRVLELKRQGLSIREIAAEVGYHLSYGLKVVESRRST
jgi:orotate phosphoribosyltransferase-like protein